MKYHNLQMREYTNGCIIIDAQPCSQKLWGRVPLGLQTYATNQVRKVLNPINFVFEQKSEVNDGGKTNGKKIN